VDGGSIRLGGRDITGLEARERDIAMVFQDYALYPHMNVRDNLRYGLRVRKTPKHEIERRVDEVAELLGLRELLDRLPAALSGSRDVTADAEALRDRAADWTEPQPCQPKRPAKALRAMLATLRVCDQGGVLNLSLPLRRTVLTCWSRVAVVVLRFLDRRRVPRLCRRARTLLRVS
jgi:hypothetical protein